MKTVFIVTNAKSISDVFTSLLAATIEQVSAPMKKHIAKSRAICSTDTFSALEARISSLSEFSRDKYMILNYAMIAYMVKHERINQDVKNAGSFHKICQSIAEYRNADPKARLILQRIFRNADHNTLRQAKAMFLVLANLGSIVKTVKDAKSFDLLSYEIKYNDKIVNAITRLYKDTDYISRSESAKIKTSAMFSKLQSSSSKSEKLKSEIADLKGSLFS